MTAMALIMLVIVMMKMAAASAPDTETDVKPGADESVLAEQTLSICNQLPPEVTEIPSNISSDTECLEVKQTQIAVIPRGAVGRLQHLGILIISKNEVLESIGAFAFAGLLQLTNIFISENMELASIGAFAFSDLPELTEMTITKSKHLRHIHPDAFRNIVKLRVLIISNTGLRMFPDFTKIHSTAPDFLFGLQENSHIERVPVNAFRGLCTQTISEIRLTRNGIKEVASDAFNGTKMHRLRLSGNQQLTHINPDAFVGSSELVVL